jgi:exopolyphosphatase/guanosine-5'-triphosphate,3'-diphosphate pyrophosphatase
MVVARAGNGRIQLIDRIRDRVALAAGLDAGGVLEDAAADRGLHCLRQFSERLRDIPSRHVRVVGTNTFRKVRDGGRFLAASTEAMGRTIEILGGAEEARLVFLGIRYDVGETDLPLLAIDIGGGSTELAMGRSDTPSVAESVQVGCVGLSSRFFPNGKLTRSRMKEAAIAAGVELEPIAHLFAGAAADIVASSGTALAIEEIAAACGWRDSGIDRDVLSRLAKALLEAGNIDALDLPGLSDGRRPVIAGGLAAMQAVFDAVDIDHLRTSRCALREGVLVDMVGRFTGNDRRDASVAALATRSHVDQAQATRVTRTARQLFEVVEPAWDLSEDDARLLGWAAALHEVGLSISHTDYHRHGEYIVANTEMPGFSRTTQETLAGVIRLHRKRISWNRLAEGDDPTRTRIRDLALLLRVAVHLHRSRTPGTIANIGLSGTPEGLELTLTSEQAARHPLTMADLASECQQWARMGRTLDIAITTN